MHKTSPYISGRLPWPQQRRGSQASGLHLPCKEVDDDIPDSPTFPSDPPKVFHKPLENGIELNQK